MSRVLILMRHGKTEENSESGDDFERTLEPRGRIEASEAAKNLSDAGIKPDIIMASPAFRTSSTARIVADIFNIDSQKILYLKELYSGDSETYIKTANLYPDKTILIVGHNPSVAELSIYFYGSPTRGFPTSSIAAFIFENDEITLSDSPDTIYFNTRK